MSEPTYDSLYHKTQMERLEMPQDGCGGTGFIECFCAGDFCACSAQGFGVCEGCADCIDEDEL